MMEYNPRYRCGEEARDLLDGCRVRFKYRHMLTARVM